LIDSGPNHAPSAERSAECGQVLALCAVFLVVLMGMAAAAIDVGSLGRPADGTVVSPQPSTPTS